MNVERDRLQALISEHLSFRSFELTDEQLLFDWENDLSSWSSTMILNPLSHQFIRNYIQDSSTSILEKGQLIFLVEQKESKEPVGYLQLFDYEAINQKLACGIYLAKEFRGKGLAKEILSFAKSYSFNILNCRMLYAETLVSNERACHLFEREGFKPTAVLKDWLWFNGCFESVIYFQVWR